MRHRRHINGWGLILGTLCAVLATAALGHASERVTEDFHKTYPLAAQGRVSLENINGEVKIMVWDQNEVKVDAVKRGYSQNALKSAQIEVESGNDSIEIRTEYDRHDHTFWNDSRDDSASVDYTLTIPRNASLDKIELVNGPLTIDGVAGEVRASCVNGPVTVRNLSGRTKLSTVNSRLDAQFDKLAGSSIELEAVNGALVVTLPSDAQADIEASTVSGHISNDFGIRVRDHHYVGHDLHAQLGNGGARINLENVNGRIEIRHANDNHPVSQVKDLNGGGERASDDDDMD